MDKRDAFGVARPGMSAARRPALAIQDHQRATSPTEAGRAGKPRGAEGAADRPSREGAPTPRSVVRGRPGAPPTGWPRASSRPRWPDDAKITLKIADVFLHPPRCWRGEVGGGLFRRRLRHVLGIGGTYTKVPGAARARCADEFHRTPKEIAAVQARFQMAARRRAAPLPSLPQAITPPRDARRAAPGHSAAGMLPERTSTSPLRIA